MIGLSETQWQNSGAAPMRFHRYQCAVCQRFRKLAQGGDDGCAHDGR